MYFVHLDEAIGEIIMKTQFKDFCFKLAVIQVLMYEKKLLKPVFHPKEVRMRQDNKMIPSVKKYFMDLDIPAELLAKVTEIEQNPNNEVIQQIFPGWDAGGDDFIITNPEDTKLLPNLKKVIIFCRSYSFLWPGDGYEILGEFVAKGIEADCYGINKKNNLKLYNKVEKVKKTTVKQMEDFKKKYWI
ncbi:MAG TPA: hypothetical protein VNZ45_06950 [Bacteroidia bacterium]|jgi:hypothetical protein|nr:hypothetical protein [Bacteroidia bacterium]